MSRANSKIGIMHKKEASRHLNFLSNHDIIYFVYSYPNRQKNSDIFTAESHRFAVMRSNTKVRKSMAKKKTQAVSCEETTSQ